MAQDVKERMMSVERAGMEAVVGKEGRDKSFAQAVKEELEMLK